MLKIDSISDSSIQRTCLRCSSPAARIAADIAAAAFCAAAEVADADDEDDEDDDDDEEDDEGAGTREREDEACGGRGGS